MNEITEFLTYLGNSGFDYLVVPILIWTVLALAALALFKLSDNIHPAYQYHGRIAILCSLPLGIFTSYAGSWNLFSSPESSEALTKFFVIQNPISVSSAAETETVTLLDPTLLTGFVMILALAIMAGYLIKILLDIWSLNQFAQKLNYHSLEDLSTVVSSNKKMIANSKDIKVAFSKEVEVPFTFGVLQKAIVLPSYLSNESEKMNMALRHELIHIKHGDYLLNIVLMTIKGTFWLHPLVHKFYKDFKNYRELLCDSQVLADESIPQRGYAELLFELAPKNVFPNYPTVSMSVNSSTLKKRIQTMKTQHSKNTSTFSSSLTLMVLSLFFITGIMACTHIEDNGITNSEIEETQRQLATPPPPNSSEDKQPTFMLNGEVVKENSKNLLPRIKTKYIENIEVLKGQKAIDEFGEKLGKNGVVNVKLYDKEAALNDLKPLLSPPPPSSSKQQDSFKVVEEMPKLIGGLQALTECVEYPERAKRAGIEGKVIVSFTVTEDGNVENPEILRGIGGGADEEVIRCIKQMEFEPGLQRGKAVRVQIARPVQFKL